MYGAWPFTGRAAEVSAILSAVGRSGQGSAVIVGPPGTGKTRLLRELAAHLRHQRGFTVLEAQATGTTSGYTFGCLGQVLPRIDLRGAFHTYTFAAAQALTNSGGRPTVLMIDDAHQLDPASAAVVHFLARHRRMGVVLTIRADEPVHDAVGNLWKDGDATRLDLQPIDVTAVAAMLSKHLKGPVDDGWVSRVWRRVAGDLLYLREVIEDGTLINDEGLWRQRHTGNPTPRLVDLVHHRIGQLTGDETYALEIVAMGEPLELATVLSLTDPRAIEQLEQRGLVIFTRDRRRTSVRLAHPLHGQITLQACPVMRRRRIQSELAASIEAFGMRRQLDHLRVASWRLESGTAHDPEVLYRAGQSALAGWDLTLAARLSEAALETGGKVPAACLLATVLCFQHRHQEALQRLEQVADLVATVDDRIGWTATSAFVQFWGLDQVEAAEALVREGLSGIESDGRSSLIVFAAGLDVHKGHYQDAADASVAELSSPGLPAEVTALALTVQAYAQAPLGRSNAAIAAYRRAATELAAVVPTVPSIARGLDTAYCLALILAGEVRAADAHAADALALIAELPGPDDLRAALFTAIRSVCARLHGRVRDAIALAAQAFSLSHDTLAYPSFAAAEKAHAAALLGDAATASAAMTTADQERRRSLDPVQQHLELARAWVALPQQGLAAAQQVARDTARRYRDRGLLGYEAFACHDLARLGDPNDAADRLTQLASTVDGQMADCCATYAEGLRHGDGSALETASRKFENLGLDLFAAEAANAAAGVLRHRAEEAAARARVLLSRCQGAITPGLRGVATVKLTERQWEIALLAASGATNKEIAQRLNLSPSTVENHLRPVYATLGISDRNSLSRILRHTT